MSAAVLIQEDDIFQGVFPHSKAKTSDIGKIAESIRMNNIARNRHLTIGGGAYQTDDSKIITITEVSNFNLSVERHRSDDVRHATVEMNLQLDLIQAAGAMTAQLKDSITEIVSNANSMTTEDQKNIVRVVFNTYQLQQANDGRIVLSTDQMESMAKDTLDTMTILAKEVVLPEQLKSISTQIISQTASKFQIPSLPFAIVKFKQDTAPTKILNQTVEAVKKSLQVLLDSGVTQKSSPLSHNDITAAARWSSTPAKVAVGNAVASLSRSPASIASISQTRKIASTPSVPAPVKHQLKRVEKIQIQVAAQTHNVKEAAIKNTVELHNNLSEIAEGYKPENPIKNVIQSALDNIDKSPFSLTTLVGVKEAVLNIGAGQTPGKIPEVMAQAQSKLPELANILKTNVVDVITTKTGQSRDIIQQQITNVLDSVGQGTTKGLNSVAKSTINLSQSFTNMASVGFDAGGGYVRKGVSFTKEVAKKLGGCITCDGTRGCCPSFKSVAEYTKSILRRDNNGNETTIESKGTSNVVRKQRNPK